MRSQPLGRYGALAITFAVAAVSACTGQGVDIGDPEGGAGSNAGGAGNEAGRGGGESGSTGGAGPVVVGEAGTAGSGPRVDAGTLDPEELAPQPGVTKTDKVDVLLVVDNSASMQDKQMILHQSLPMLLSEIVNPPCVDESGAYAAEWPASPSEDCPTDTMRTHVPVKDMHIGVVTSSLGGHGNAEFCSRRPMEDDQGRLLSWDNRPDDQGVTDGYNGMGFLAWDAREASDPEKHDSEATDSIDELLASTQKLVVAAGEEGCGYEATLEAWYRFLVDPKPPESVVQDGTKTVAVGTDATVLEQRADFLRPDSALVIVILSDENDCSIKDSGYGWMASQRRLYRGTSACDSDPNDPCCVSCGLSKAPEGCPSLSEDPNCQLERDDATNVRCWDMKRRFGIDFLYPVTRYVAALSDAVLCPDSSAGDGDCACRHARELGQDCDPGEPVANPIYQDLTEQGRPVRDRSLVSAVSIVGVPWQDLATDDTARKPDQLRYKAGVDLDWDLILGDPTQNIAPEDTLMVESTTPRSGPPHPITGIAPAPSDAPAWANPINGHEWEPVNNEDLEYACIFSLAPILESTTRDCNIIAKQTCDCFDPTEGLVTVNARRKPLCQTDEDAYSSVQLNAKAYPGLRHLDFIRGMGNRGYAASICPKVLDGSANDPAYGYNPALGGVLRTLRRVLK